MSETHIGVVLISFLAVFSGIVAKSALQRMFFEQH